MNAVLIPKGQSFSSLLKVKINGDRSVLIMKEHLFEKPVEALEHEEESEEEMVNSQSTSFAAKQLIDSGMLAHDDFVRAMNNLKFHMLCLTEVLHEEDFTAKDVEKIMGFAGKPAIPKAVKDIMNDFEVRSLHLSGDTDKKGFIISGVHIIRKKTKKIAVNTPRMLFEGEAHPYKFTNIMTQVIEIINDEAEEYLRGKCYWDGQLTLTLGDKSTPITKTGTDG